MFDLARAQRHIGKAARLTEAADDLHTEVKRWNRAGEVDDNGVAPGNSEEAQRLMDKRASLIYKAELHTGRARTILAEYERRLETG